MTTASDSTCETLDSETPIARAMARCFTRAATRSSFSSRPVVVAMCGVWHVPHVPSSTAHDFPLSAARLLAQPGQRCAKVRHMAARKTDADRGPLGAWAYRTRDLLDLSSEAVAAALGVHDGTIRKIEGGSNREPSAHLLRALYGFYLERAETRERPLAIEPPPGLLPEANQPVESDLTSALRDLVLELRKQNDLLREEVAVLRNESVRRLEALETIVLRSETPQDRATDDAAQDWADEAHTSSRPQRPVRHAGTD